jgi:beta-N-acetylhexosaminidase
VDAPRAALAASDFAPFAALADAPLGMTAHVLYTALDPERPATLSPEAIGAIRGEIGFDGLLMTDDIGMGALSGPVAARADAAIAAGCDVVLHCNGDLDEMEAVADAVPVLAGPAAERAARAEAARHAPDAADLSALEARYHALAGEAA